MEAETNMHPMLVTVVGKLNLGSYQLIHEKLLVREAKELAWDQTSRPVWTQRSFVHLITKQPLTDEGHMPAITTISKPGSSLLQTFVFSPRAIILKNSPVVPHSQYPEKQNIQERLIYQTDRWWLSFTSSVFDLTPNCLSQSTLLSPSPTHWFLHTHNSVCPMCNFT